jgi:NADH dehydrogenase [ubiquinone] 1 alpha subcomplex assembly factor 5
VPELFDMDARAIRRDRAARAVPELFLYERAFEDCLDRLALMQRRFERGLLIGCPDPAWPGRLRDFVVEIDVRDPGPSWARKAGGDLIIEDAWLPEEAKYDLVIAIATLDSVNDLPLALRLIRYAMRDRAVLLGAVSGGDTLRQLRNAMRAADTVSGGAAPHVHPRIDASSLAPLLQDAGFIDPVIDIDRVPVAYRSFERLVSDMRRMGATNVLTERPRFVGRAARAAAIHAFSEAGDGSRTVETFEIVHFVAWTTK